MKKRLLVLVYCLGVMTVLSAQHYEQVSMKDFTISKDKTGQVLLNFTLFVPAKTVRANDILTLNPVLVVNAGNEQYALPPVRIYGRISARSEHRRNVLEKTDIGPRSGFVCHNGDTLVYSSEFAYQPWMQDVTLVLRRQLMNCCSEQELVVKKLYTYSFEKEEPAVQPLPIVAEPLPPVLSVTERLAQMEHFVEPIENYVPQKKIVAGTPAEAQIVYFKLDRAEIDKGYSDNEKVLQHVVEVTRRIQKDPEAEIVHIVLLGLSSPEGSYEYNRILAGKRAAALKRYITDYISLPDSCFELVNGGEGWDELRYQVSQSADMPDKDAVLRIIDNVAIWKGRELQLMKLHQGIPYRYMRQRFFPQLRRAGYIKVYYRKKTISQEN